MLRLAQNRFSSQHPSQQLRPSVSRRISLCPIFKIVLRDEQRKWDSVGQGETRRDSSDLPDNAEDARLIPAIPTSSYQLA